MSARFDALLASALVGISLAAWLWLIPAFAGRGEQAIMPRLAVAMVGALALFMLATNLVRMCRMGAGPAAAGDEDPFLELDGHGEPIARLPIVAVWGVVLTWPGFFGLHLGSAIAVVVTFVCVGITRPLTIAVWTILPVAALHLMFEYAFSLRIPRGFIVSYLLG